MAVYTLFGQPASPASLTSDASTYTMGVQFSVSQSCTLTAIWWFSASGAANLPSVIALYAVSGTSLVASQSGVTWSGAAGSGWVRAAWTSPPSLTASTQYKGCIGDFANSGNFYASTSHYWDTGAGSGGITSGPLSAPNNAGSSPGQDSFHNSGALAYPDTTFNSTNYWVDVEVTTAPASRLLMASFP